MELSVKGNVNGPFPLYGCGNKLCTLLYISISLFTGDISYYKWPGREADHSPSSNTEVKNGWMYTSIPPIWFHGMVLN